MFEINKKSVYFYRYKSFREVILILIFNFCNNFFNANFQKVLYEFVISRVVICFIFIIFSGVLEARYHKYSNRLLARTNMMNNYNYYKLLSGS